MEKMNKFLDEIADMTAHNAMCYSKDFMETPKPGYEKEFYQEYEKLALIGKLKEIVKEYYKK